MNQSQDADSNEKCRERVMPRAESISGMEIKHCIGLPGMRQSPCQKETTSSCVHSVGVKVWGTFHGSFYWKP